MNLLRLFRSRPKLAPHELPFQVYRDHGADFYATGVTKAFRDDPRGVYHVLSCKKIRDEEIEACRKRAVDRRLVEEILLCEKRADQKAAWSTCLFDGRNGPDLDSATHHVRLEYCLSSGRCRALIEWPFDFGFVPKRFPSQVAQHVCELIVYMLDRELCNDKAMLIPSEGARAFWHTAVQRVLVEELGMRR